MIERAAEWTLNPVTERELTRDRRQERRRRGAIVLLAVTVLGLCSLSCLGSCLTFESPVSGTFLLLSLASIPLSIFAGVRYAALRESTRQRRLALRSEYGGVFGWLVEMSIYQGESLSGRDVGIVWFDEGRLFFTGGRTSFGLGRGDVQGRVTEGWAVLDPGVTIQLPLRERTMVGPVSVGLRLLPQEPEANDYVASEAGLRDSLRGWLGSVEQEQGQLPPIALGPDLPDPRVLVLRAVAASTVWPALALLISAVCLLGGAFWALFLVVAGIAVALWKPALSPRRCWRAVHDRRRLEAYNREQ